MTLNAEQLAMRKSGITGSEIAAVNGLSPFIGPHEVWGRKLGLIPDPKANKNMERGTFLEPAIRNWMRHRLTIGIEEPQTARHKKHPIVIATDDGRAFPITGGDPFAVVEIKCPGDFTDGWEKPEERADGIPSYVYAQVVWEMAVADLDVAIVGVFQRGDLVTYQIPYNQEMFENMLEQAYILWELVKQRKPPKYDGTERAAAFLKKFYSTDNGEMIDMTGKHGRLMEDTLQEFLQAKQDKKEVTSRLIALGASVQEIISDNMGLETDNFKATWKTTKDRTKIDWQGIVKEIDPDPDPELVYKHTTTKPGHRMFLVKEKKGAKDE